MRYEMPDDVTAPEVSATVRPEEPRRTAVVFLGADDDSDDSPTVHVRVDGGEWSEYSRPVVLRRGQQLEYRAIDDAWNSTPVQTYSID